MLREAEVSSSSKSTVINWMLAESIFPSDLKQESKQKYTLQCQSLRLSQWFSNSTLMKEKQTNTFADCAILAFILPVLNLNPFFCC